jgi:DNA-binding MarR family transcriptional regulator
MVADDRKEGARRKRLALAAACRKTLVLCLSMADEHSVSVDSTPQLELLLALRQHTTELETLLDRELSQWHGISADDFWMLLVVHRTSEGEMSRRALAEQLGVRLTDLVKRIRPLQRIGIVAEPSEVGNDPRTTSVALTPRGTELLSEALKSANDVADGALDSRWDARSLDALFQAFGVDPSRADEMLPN